MSLTGSCHCGAVRVEVPGPPASVTDCNCSICRRYGTLWAYYPAAQVTVHASPEALARYAWGPRSLWFVRCATCGCVTHWEPIAPRDAGRMGVNANTFDLAVLAALPVRHLDGAVTERYLD